MSLRVVYYPSGRSMSMSLAPSPPRFVGSCAGVESAARSAIARKCHLVIGALPDVAAVVHDHSQWEELEAAVDWVLSLVADLLDESDGTSGSDDDPGTPDGCPASASATESSTQ